MTSNTCHRAATKIKVAFPPAQPSLLMQIALTYAHAPARIALPPAPALPHRAPRRRILAAMRAAELEHWQATGGDSLRAPVLT